MAKYLYYPNAYGAEYRIRATDPRGNITTVIHDTSVVQAVIDPLGTRTTYVWEGSGDSRIRSIIDTESNRTTLSYQNLYDGTQALSSIERPVIGSLQFQYGANGQCGTVKDFDGNRTTCRGYK